MIRQEIINGKQFLNKLGLGTGAIMATYCLGGQQITMRGVILWFEIRFYLEFGRFMMTLKK